MAKRSRKKRQLTDVAENKRETRINDIEDLASHELTAGENNTSLSTSETDTDEREATGNGRIERSDNDPFK